jgi:hypothetical protein
LPSLVADSDLGAVVGALGRVGQGDRPAGRDASGGPGDGGRVEQVVDARAGDGGRQGDAVAGEQPPARDQSGSG